MKLASMERLIKRLAAQGFIVTDIVANDPAIRYRENGRLAWDAYALQHPKGNEVSLVSYDSVTRCLRYGFEIVQNAEAEFNVYAKDVA